MLDPARRVSESKKFLSELWAKAPPDWFAEITLLQYTPTPQNPDAKRAEALVFPLDEVERDWDGEIFPQLERFNAKFAANIHHGVNPRRRRPPSGFGKNEDIEAYVSLWVDVDFRGHEEAIRKQFEEAVALLRDAGLPPSVVIDSGHGLHAYWFLDKPYPVAEARPCCAGIMDFFKISDPIHDPRRLLRVPGFTNVKDPKNPKECRIVEATWARYPLSAFADYRVELAKSAPAPSEAGQGGAPAPPPSSVKTVSRDPRIEEAKRGVPEGGGPYGGRHNAAVALAGHYCSFKDLSKKTILNEMLSWNARNSPPLPEKEITSIVEDIWGKEQIKRAEEELREEDSRPPWLKDGWRPAPLADHLMMLDKYLATPTTEDGRGVNLFRYEGGVYRPGGFYARRVIRNILGDESEEKKIQDVIDSLLESAKCPYEDVNKNACELINVANGMLNWRTGELLPHDPKYLSLSQIPVPWEPEARSAKLDEFLNSVLPPDALQTAEEFIGYLLIPSTEFAKALVLVGEGGNGKSTFLRLVSALLGKKNISNCSLHSLSENRFTAVRLFGKLANFYDEIETRALEETSFFKQIVTGDAIQAEEKFHPQFTFEPYARLVFATNKMPRSTDQAHGFFERLIFLVFAHKFRHTKGEIRNYGKVLAGTPGVLPALLVRAVAGLRRLMERGGFDIPESATGALEEYKRECNSGYDFVREFCIPYETGWIAKASLYEYYKRWCEVEGRKALSAREFNRVIQQALGAKEERRNNARGWSGVTWKDNGAPPRIGLDELEKLESLGNGGGRIDVEF
jgi:P4 family phage/plasmid primase-like protien